MKRPVFRLFVASLTLNAALLTAMLSAPTATFACSCAPTEVADFVGDPKYVIVSGDIVAVDQGRGSGTFRVGRVFQGRVPALQLAVFGTGGGDCTIQLEEGMQFIGVAQLADGAFAPMSCLPFGDLRDARGQEISAEIQRLFPAAAADPISFEELVSLVPIAAGAVGLGLLIILGLVALTRRRRSVA
jgi:hypothetical protein